jgi:hypothetical protein
VDSLNGKTFTGKITRFTDKVDEDTRTMITKSKCPIRTWNCPGHVRHRGFESGKPPATRWPFPLEAVAGGNHGLMVNANNEIEERAGDARLETPTSTKLSPA